MPHPFSGLTMQQVAERNGDALAVTYHNIAGRDIGTDVFAPSEFRHPELMGVSFIDWLVRVRRAAGCPMIVTSDARTHDENTAADGAENSAHLDVPCNAVDIEVANDEDRFKVVSAALTMGCQRIGIYADGHIHLDRTEDSRPWPVLFVKSR